MFVAFCRSRAEATGMIPVAGMELGKSEARGPTDVTALDELQPQKPAPPPISASSHLFSQASDESFSCDSLFWPFIFGVHQDLRRCLGGATITSKQTRAWHRKMAVNGQLHGGRTAFRGQLNVFTAIHLAMLVIWHGNGVSMQLAAHPIPGSERAMASSAPPAPTKSRCRTILHFRSWLPTCA